MLFHTLTLSLTLGEIFFCWHLTLAKTRDRDEVNRREVCESQRVWWVSVWSWSDTFGQRRQDVGGKWGCQASGCKNDGNRNRRPHTILSIKRNVGWEYRDSKGAPQSDTTVGGYEGSETGLLFTHSWLTHDTSLTTPRMTNNPTAIVSHWWVYLRNHLSCL